MATSSPIQATPRHRRILKYPLALGAEPQTIRMPPGALIVDVHEQHQVPTLWAEVSWENEHKPFVECGFVVVGTGQTIPQGYFYVGSAHCGEYVWHVCESS